MTSQPAPAPGIVGEIAQQLGAIFRHMLPGVLVVGGAAIAFPEWFEPLKDLSWPIVFVLGTVSLAVGNAWFALNRYLLDLIVDYLLWLAKHRGPARTGSSPLGFTVDIAKHTVTALTAPHVSSVIRDHLRFRASAVFLMWTLAEVMLAVGLWHSPRSILAPISSWLGWGSLIIFLFGVVQMLIIRRIDYEDVHRGQC